MRFKDLRKKATRVQTKEIKIKPNIDTNDLQVKINKAESILKKGHRVKVSMVFKGRENIHKEYGTMKMNEAISALGGVSSISSPLKLKGSNLTVILSPQKGSKK